ncbi:MAG: S41 family peptidase [Chloroflexi bacterium]|nr:S41 family peptidase [Chloroflexota bacterium]
MKTNRLVPVLFVIIITVLAFSLGYGLGGSANPTTGGGEGLDTVVRAWNVIFQDYVDKSKLDTQKLSQAAVEGMIAVLDDPYTSYLSPEDFRLNLASMRGEFEGIGAQVGTKEDRIMIIAPLPGSPAEAAGIRAGDIILEVNGESIAGLSLYSVVLRIRGTEGTPVRLLILHEGESQPVEIEIVRSRIKVSSVMSEMKEGLAYIRITQFIETTDSELTPVLQDMVAQGAEAIILDLRMNPGGILDAVVDVASHFLQDGVVARVVSNQAQTVEHPVKPGRFYTDLPMVVLVDGYSASGSELLSGALKDRGRAAVAGATTYGKGSVNIFRQLDGSGMYITTARWLTPNGTLIEGKGIEPDYPLEPDQDAIRWAIDFLKRK